MSSTPPSDQADKQPAKIFVRRGGKDFGVFEEKEFERRLREGEFQPTDLWRRDDSPVWNPIPSFQPSKPGKEAKPLAFAPAEAAQPEREPGSWEIFAETPEFRWMLAGLLLALLLVASAAGWAMYERGRAQFAESRLAELEKKSRELENRRKLYDEKTGLLEPGILRGWVILRTRTGERASVPNVALALYDRQTIARHLEEFRMQAGPEPPEVAVQKFVDSLPPPLHLERTQSAGNFEFHTTEPGEYVLVSKIFYEKSRRIRCWLLDVDTRDELNTPIVINEANSARAADPLLWIQPAR